MLAPRPVLLTFNVDDKCCFKAGHALQPLLDAALPIYRLYGAGKSVRSHVNHDPGTHNFLQDNRQQFYGMLNDFFLGGTGDKNEIPSADEIKTYEELSVALPEKNHDFNTLAKELMANLPRDRSIGDTIVWRNHRRNALRRIASFHDYQVTAKIIGRDKIGEVKVTRRPLKMGSDWTVLATELVGPKVTGTTVLVADKGRKAMAAEVVALLDRGQRVVAVDPFLFGRIPDCLPRFSVCADGGHVGRTAARPAGQPDRCRGRLGNAGLPRWTDHRAGDWSADQHIRIGRRRASSADDQ